MAKLNLYTAVELLLTFGKAENVAELKKCYKRAALAVHSDRGGDASHTMSDINLAWELVDKNRNAAEGLLGNHIETEHEKAMRLDPLRTCPMPSFRSVRTQCEDLFGVMHSKEHVWWNVQHNTVHLEDLDLEYSHYYGGSELSITETKNAFKQREMCSRYIVSVKYIYRDKFWSLWNAFCRDTIKSDVIEDVHVWLTSNITESMTFMLEGVELVIEYEEVKGSAVFSPFHLGRVKPLKEEPKKWTIVHLRRALANGQFRAFKSDYHYTDDYALDAASNFGEGYIPNPLRYFKEYFNTSLDRISFWNGKVSFGPHSNSSYSFVFVLGNRYPAVDLVEEETDLLEGKLLTEVAA